MSSQDLTGPLGAHIPHAKGTTLPVPAAAKGPAIPEEGYLTQELGDGLFWLTDGSYGMMFLVDDEAVTVVDAPPTLGNNITRAIKRVTSKPVTDVVYSHSHADHIGAAIVLPEQARRYAHRETARALADVNDNNRPAPTDVFDTSLEIGSGNRRLQLDFHGANHTAGNIHIFAPEQKTLMFVDVIFPGWVPFSYLAVSNDVPGWIRSHQATKEYDFDTFIGGHLTRTGTAEDVDTQIEYIDQLKTVTEAALSSVDLHAIFGTVDPENLWAVFNAYFNAVANSVVDTMVSEWGERLGGADIYTWSNAWAMAESLRIDFGSMGPFGIRP